MMNNLNDKKYRLNMVERYLQADTSTEEEKALADFYSRNNLLDLTDEEKAVMQLLQYHHEETTYIDMFAIEEFDRLMAEEPISTIRTALWKLTAIMALAAAMAGIIILQPWHKKESSPLQSTPQKERAEKRKPVVQQTTVLAKPEVNRHKNLTEQTAPLRRKKIVKSVSAKNTEVKQETNIDMIALCSAVAQVMPQASCINIKQSNDSIYVRLTQEDGTESLFSADCEMLANKDILTLTAMEQETK